MSLSWDFWTQKRVEQKMKHDTGLDDHMYTSRTTTIKFEPAPEPKVKTYPDGKYVNHFNAAHAIIETNTEYQLAPSQRIFMDKILGFVEMHLKKGADYGTEGDPFANVRASEEFGVPAPIGIAIRMNDKMTRLKSFAKKGRLENESFEDSLLDIGVYALIALTLMEEKEREKGNGESAQVRRAGPPRFVPDEVGGS